MFPPVALKVPFTSSVPVEIDTVPVIVAELAKLPVPELKFKLPIPETVKDP